MQMIFARFFSNFWQWLLFNIYIEEAKHLFSKLDFK